MKKTKRTNTVIYLLVSGGALLVLVAIILASQTPNVATALETSSAGDIQDDETYPEIPRINIEDAKITWDTGTAIFLDVRDADAYKANHLTGAVNIPLAELASRFDELERGKQIIPYCT